MPILRDFERRLGGLVEGLFSKAFRSGVQPVEIAKLIMREMEELSYNQISIIADLPIGTVMSRLARGRKRLRDLLVSRMSKEILN